MTTWGLNIKRVYFGFDFGAQTTANDSGSMRWNPECVCRSTDDMKLDCVYAALSTVKIARRSQKKPTQPSVMRERSSVNLSTSSSSSIVQVSLVACCFGMSSVVTLYLCPLSFPSSSPHVSRFLSVLTFAIARKRGRHSRGKLTLFSGIFGSNTASGGTGMRPVCTCVAGMGGGGPGTGGCGREYDVLAC